jgi:hypothetical protein
MVRRLILAAILVAAAAAQARAAFVPAADLINYQQGPLGLPANTVVGYMFTVGANPITVDELAIFSGTGSLTQPINVHIWLTNTTTDVASVNVSSADTLSNDGRFYYTSITPVTLLPNTNYSIGADLPFANQGAMGPGTLINDPSFTVTAAIAGPAPYANSDALDFGPLFGPSFQLVPEPSTLMLAVCGAIGLVVSGARRWRAKRMADRLAA